MNDKILITGASGFLGYHLLKEAKSKGLTTIAAVRKTSNIDHLEGLVDSYIDLDYTSVEKLREGIQGCTYIVHAAAMTRSKDPEMYRRVNVQYAHNLALAAQDLDYLKSFVFVSSLAAIGPVDYDSSPILENVPQNPITGYGQSKKAAEAVLLSVEGLPLTIVRPTAIYGPREKDLLVLLKTILGGIDLYIGTQAQKLSFIHGSDAAKAIILAAIKEFVEIKAYNLTDGQFYSRYAIADILNELRGKKAFRMHLPVGLVSLFAGGAELAYTFSKDYPVLYKERIKEVTAQNWYCDTNELVSTLGFSPEFNLETGLYDAVSWYKKAGWM